MSKFTSIINSFRTGKISKKLAFRQDIDALKDSALEMDNAIVLPSGGSKTRLGTTILSSHSLPSIGNLYELKYSKKHSYVVMLENTNSNIFETTTRGSLTNTSKLVRVFSGNVEYKVHTMLSAELHPYIDTSYSAFNSSIESPYSKLPSNEWQTCQLSRKLVFVHTSGTKMPFIVDLILSSGEVSFLVYPWTIDKDLYTRSALYELFGGSTLPIGSLCNPVSGVSTNSLSTATHTTLTGSYTSGKIVTMGGVSDKRMFRSIVITNFNGFFTSDMNTYIGATIQLTNASNQDGLYTIVGYDATYAYPDVKFWVICSVESTAGNFSTSKWAISSWGGPRGFPKSVTAYKGRVVFGATEIAPNSFWATAVNSNNPYSFQNTFQVVLSQDLTTDFSGLLFFGSSVSDKGIAASFNESVLGDIRFIRGRKFLHFGTNVGEHQVSFTNNVFAAANMEASKVSSYQSSPVQTCEGDQKIFYVANNKTEIRYISTNDKFSESEDISLSALNREYEGISKIQWCEENSCLLFLTSDKKLHGVTVNQQTQTAAFFDLTFPFSIQDFVVLDKGGLYGDDGSSAYIIADMGAGAYLLVHMAFSATDFYIFDPSKIEEVHLLDLAKVTTGTGSSSFTSLIHANKGTIGYYLNGVYGETEVDANGNFNIDNSSGDSIIYGIPYTSKIRSCPINIGSKYGSATGLIKRIDTATVHAIASGSYYLGSTNGKMYLKSIGQISDSNETVEFSNNPDYTVDCIVQSVNGQPLNISSISFRGVTYEGE